MKFEEKFEIILAYSKDQNIPIVYSSKYREFGIEVQDGGSSYIMLEYCPFTGKKLPLSLRDSWFSIIENMGLEPNSPEIPIKYLSDQWWNVE